MEKVGSGIRGKHPGIRNTGVNHDSVGPREKFEIIRELHLRFTAERTSENPPKSSASTSAHRCEKVLAVPVQYWLPCT
jgi:hypothetical protein